VTAVRVTEPVITATQMGIDWWLDFRRFHVPGRFTVVEASLAGEVVDVACDDREHADWLAAEMVRNGIPKRGVRVLA
jgi:hypothetical protein